MKRKTKRLLGAFGLVGVIAMTAVAYAIPAPEVAAVQEDISSGDSDVTVKVTVRGPGYRLTLESPTSGTTVTSGIIPVRYSFDSMKSIVTNLSCTMTDGSTVDTVVNTFEATSLDESSGERAFNIELAAYNVIPTATCTVSLSGVDWADGVPVAPDGVAITYRAVDVNMGDDDEGGSHPITDEKGDPEVTIQVRDDVYSLMLQVYDKSGNPVFVAKDGTEESIVVWRDEFDLTNMVYKMNLPMSQYGAKAGWYELVVVAYGADGTTVVSMNVYRFYYDPGAPNVPGTGLILNNLNISRADYVITGLIAFGAVAAFAVYLMLRKSRH